MVKGKVLWNRKWVKKPRFNIGDMVKFPWLKSDKKYPITKKSYRGPPQNTWVYKVNGKWWNETSIAKRRTKKK